MNYKNYPQKKNESMRKKAFIFLQKAMEVFGLSSLALVDVWVTQRIIDRVIAPSEEMGLAADLLSWVIAFAFWYVNYSFVSSIISAYNRLKKQRPTDTFLVLVIDALAEEPFAAIASVILISIDLIWDSLNGVPLIYANVTAFDLFDKLYQGPPVMYFMMITIAFLTVLGEPIVISRIRHLGITENYGPPKNYPSKPQPKQKSYSGYRSVAKSSSPGYTDKERMSNN